jgi:multicomponent Na+:H+ antiporter subunit D
MTGSPLVEMLPPGAILVLGAFLVPALRGRARSAYMLLLPVLGFVQLLLLAPGEYLSFPIFDYDLTPVRVDRLSLLWGYIFHIAAFVMVIFALRVKGAGEHVAALTYAGAAVGAVFAGDLVTLFVFWEGTAIASVFLIWATRTERSYHSGMRYLIIQVGSGVLLLAGALVRVWETGSLDFNFIGLDGAGGVLIFLAFGIKAAFPLLHNWLQDAYPEATVSGTVWLSAFTTKLAIYALARGFPGTEILIPIGTLMTLFPIPYAVIENDFRRVLAYSLNNQLGFMVVGIGVGTELALNGTASHAFAHIIYKALLFMSMGAVLYRTGTIKGSELGGLYKSMPWTAAFCVIGAASISAFPLFSGFVSKSLILTATAENHHTLYFFLLILASAGVMEHSGIKIPFFTFFGHDSGLRVKEAPRSMLVAMGILAFLCIGIGVYPQPLYDVLPFPVDYEPYTMTHVVTQLQLLVWAALAFAVLKRYSLYPSELPSTNLSTDWLYRRLFPAAWAYAVRVGGGEWDRTKETWRRRIMGFLQTLHRYHGPRGILARTWPAGSMTLWVAILLLVVLLVFYL